ncbi:MAG: type II toxin-antitoxin system VapC family toxin [Acidimicrobiia bacterium]
MIFIDSNIPMYLVGGPHPHKGRAKVLLESTVRRSIRLVTDAEVLQEILHRYVAIDRPSAIQPAFDALLGVVDEVAPVDLSCVERAKNIVMSGLGLSARDALHLAVMEAKGITEIMTFDSGFDVFPGVERLF